MESRAHGARWLAEHFGDLRRLVAEVEAEDEDRALLRDEPAECTIELVAITDGQEIVGGGRTVEREHPQVGHPPALAPCLLDADVRDESVDPRVEPVRIAEARKVTPSD